MNDNGFGEAGFGEGPFGDGLAVHTVAVENTADDWTRYAFETDGTRIEKNGDLGSINEGDTIDGTAVRGRVWNGVDAYEYDGELVAVDWVGPRLRLTVDGTELTDDELDTLHTPLMTQTATIELVLQANSLTVTVLDGTQDDQPTVEDATVDLSGAATDSGTTDADGQVVFEGLEVADYTVEAYASGLHAMGEVAAGDFTST